MQSTFPSKMICHLMCNISKLFFIWMFLCHLLSDFDQLGTSIGTFTYFVIICAFKNIVPFGHKELWRPLAANGGSCDLKDVVTFGHNQLWRPPTAKFHLWFQENDYIIYEQALGLLSTRLQNLTILEGRPKIINFTFHENIMVCLIIWFTVCTFLIGMKV